MGEGSLPQALDRHCLGKYNNSVLKINNMEEQIKPQATINDVFEVVNFIKDNAVSKEEFRKEITAIKSTMATKNFVTEKLSYLQRILSLEPFPSLM